MLRLSTYKRKLKVGVISFLLFILLCYILSFRNTINLINNCSELSDLLSEAENAPGRIAYLKAELNEIEQVIGSNIVDNPDYRQLLLENVSQYCQNNRLTLKEFPITHKYQSKDYIIETNTMVIEGSFIPILNLINTMEKTFSAGMLSSVYFFSIRDYKSNKNLLNAKILFQNIKKVENADT